MEAPSEGDSSLCDMEMPLEDVTIYTPTASAQKIDEIDSSDLYDDDGNVIHLHQLPESLIKLRDTMDDTSDKSIEEPWMEDNQSHDSSASHSSMRVSISDPEPAASLAISKSIQKMKESTSIPSRMNINNSPSHSAILSHASDTFLKTNAGMDHEDNDQVRDNYVRSAARFRSLLDDAFRKTIMGYNHMAGTIIRNTDEPVDDTRQSPQETGKKRKIRYSEPIHDPSRQTRLSLMFRDINTDENLHPNKISTETVAATLLKEKVAEILLLQKVSLYIVHNCCLRNSLK